MNKLTYFKGKICTILTGTTTRHFNETQHTNTFVGLVEDIDEYGVWILQLNTKKKSFFTANSLVGIIEETVTPLTEDEARKVREELGTRIPEKNPQQRISVDSLKMLKRNQENK